MRKFSGRSTPPGWEASNTMNPCDTIQELRRQFRDVKSGCAGDTIFGAKALMFLCELAIKNKKQPRRQSKYNRFFAAGIKAGKTAKQIGEEWSRKN